MMNIDHCSVIEFSGHDAAFSAVLAKARECDCDYVDVNPDWWPMAKVVCEKMRVPVRIWALHPNEVEHRKWDVAISMELMNWASDWRPLLDEMMRRADRLYFEIWHSVLPHHLRHIGFFPMPVLLLESYLRENGYGMNLLGNNKPGTRCIVEAQR